MILLDTNILIYATDTLAPQHQDSKRILDAVVQARVRGAIVPQVLVEYFRVVTGQTIASPLSVAQALDQTAAFQNRIRTLHPPAEVLDQFRDIALTVGHGGRRAFDLYLAAQARALGIGTICTYNRTHFAGIEGIQALLPSDIAISTREW